MLWNEFFDALVQGVGDFHAAYGAIWRAVRQRGMLCFRPMPIAPGRVRIIHPGKPGTDGPVLYWMFRDQRLHDNWALLYAQQEAMRRKTDLHIVFCFVHGFLGATMRQHGFIIKGLQEMEHATREKGIGFHVLVGDPPKEVMAKANGLGASLIVRDMFPLRISKMWNAELLQGAHAIECVEVDAHNIVPVWQASPKQEFGAYTIRTKINKLLPQFLTDFPRLGTMEKTVQSPQVDWEKAKAVLRPDETVGEVDWIKPGEKEARRAMTQWVGHGLGGYDDGRNDPNQDAQSGLSPYLHFGQLSAQRLALEVREAKAPMKDRDAFLEELIMRRELADNFCFYNEMYDACDGFPAWARASLDAHRKDPREYLYTKKQFEKAETHDALWNAAQRQLALTGKMHGYMRMYWAKKILEWTASPEEAMEIAVYLNDRYELDGRDPNGYAGIAWSIGGVHDRAWFERPIFGKVRYMNANGARSKFDVGAYVKTWTGEDTPKSLAES